jgi:hypothetical protein
MPFGVRKNLLDCQVGLYYEAGTFKVILHQAGDIRIVFQHKNRLTQA